MLFEFQLSSKILGYNIRNELRNIKIGVDKSFTILGNTWMIDRILVLNETTLKRQKGSFTIYIDNGTQTVKGFKAVILQPLQLNVVTIQDLYDNGPDPSPLFFTPVLTILIDVTAFVKNGNAQLQFSFNSIDWGNSNFLDDATKKEIEDIVSSKVQPITKMIDLGSIQSLLEGDTLSATNAGVIATGDGGIIILRVEVNGADDQASAWTAFYNTYTRNLLEKGDWALLMDKDILIKSIKDNLSAQFKVSNEEDIFSLESDIGVSWNYAPRPVFNIDFRGKVIDACHALGWKEDVNVDVSTSITLQAPGNDILRSHIYTTYDPDEKDTVWCALTAALFWPVIGILYMHDGQVTFGEYLLGCLAEPAVIFIAVFVIAGNQDVAKQVSGQGKCNQIDDETIDCDQPFLLNMSTFGGSYHLSAVGAQPEGPVLSGTATAQDLPDPQIEIQSFGEFRWQIGGSCSGGAGPQLSGGLAYQNATVLNLQTCGVLVLDDPLNVYQKIENNNSVTIYPILSDDYLANPYPCILRIISNGGIRIITFAAAKDITKEESTKLEHEAIEAKANCYKEFTLPWSIMKVKWLPYPVPDREIAQLWQIFISEMTDLESFDIIGRSDNVFATALPNSRGVGQLSFWSEAQDQYDEIAVKFKSAGAKQTVSKTKNVVKRHVGIKQAQFILLSRIGFAGSFERMSINRLGNSTAISIQTSSGEFLYDIGLPQFPSLQASRRVASEKRLVFERPNLRLFHQDEELALVNNEGSLLATISCPLPTHAAVARDFLFIIREKTIETFKLSELGTPEKILHSKLPVEGGVHIQRASIAGVSLAFCITDLTGGSTIVDFSDLNSPKEIGHYFHTPWFINSYSSRRIFAKLSTDSRHVSIYEEQEVIDI